MSNNAIPQVSGNYNIVSLKDLQGNENLFLRCWIKGNEVLIRINEVIEGVAAVVDSDFEEIKKYVPQDTSEQNPLVNISGMMEIIDRERSLALAEMSQRRATETSSKNSGSKNIVDSYDPEDVEPRDFEKPTDREQKK